VMLASGCLARILGNSSSATYASRGAALPRIVAGQGATSPQFKCTR